LLDGLEDGISVVNTCVQRNCSEKGIEKVQYFGLGKHDIVAAEDKFLCHCQVEESMALTKIVVKNCVSKITGLEAFSNGRRKPIDKTIDATDQIAVLEMPGDYFKLAAEATQKNVPSRRLDKQRPGGAKAGSRDPSAGALPRAGWFC